MQRAGRERVRREVVRCRSCGQPITLKHVIQLPGYTFEIHVHGDGRELCADGRALAEPWIVHLLAGSTSRRPPAAL